MNAHFPFFDRTSSFVVSVGFVIALAACGEGGVVNPGSGGTGNNQTDTTAIGPIDGFGSIIVNGVRFDESVAIVTDERGRKLTREELRLGLMLRVSGSTFTGSTDGIARNVVVFRQLKGFIESVG